jgi:subtilisin family serine protease
VLREGTSAAEAPATTPEELAAALSECVEHGARIVNVSLGVLNSSARGDRALKVALDHAARRGCLIVAAAGNQGTVGSSALTSHPWVIPVVACDPRGAVLPLSNLGPSIGRRGLAAPGSGVTSLLPGNTTLRGGGTSVAAPFVTGALALLWSLFPHAAGHELKHAILQVHMGRPPGIVPPRLDAERAFASFQRARG